MKFFIALILCFFCFSFETSAIYRMEKQGISKFNSSDIQSKKLTYKERFALKYLKFKAKSTKANKATRGFLVAAILFLIIGIVLTASSRHSNQSGNLVDTADGCLTGILALVSFVISVVMFIAAAVAAI